MSGYVVHVISFTRQVRGYHDVVVRAHRKPHPFQFSNVSHTHFRNVSHTISSGIATIHGLGYSGFL